MVALAVFGDGGPVVCLCVMAVSRKGLEHEASCPFGMSVANRITRAQTTYVVDEGIC